MLPVYSIVSQRVFDVALERWFLTGGFCRSLQESLNRHMFHHDPHAASLKVSASQSTSVLKERLEAMGQQWFLSSLENRWVIFAVKSATISSLCER